MTRRTSDREVPLLAWGEALRARHARARYQRRIGIAAALPGMLVLATLAAPPAPRLVWNASASAPIGLYWVTPGAQIAQGDMVIARTPKPWRAFAARRRYLPANVPLVKRAAAVAGDEVCAIGPAIFVNGVPVAARAAADPDGRTLPWWEGCLRLRAHQLFPLMERADSFDGRYLGVVGREEVIGKAVLLWRR